MNHTMKLMSAAALAMTVSAPVHAQWGDLFKQTVSIVTGTPVGSGGDPLQIQEQTLSNYKKASENINTALEQLALAYGMKDQAALLKAEIANMQSGAVLDKDAVAKNSALSSATLELITAKISSGESLTSEGKSHYVKALSPFAQGMLIATTTLPANFASMSSAYSGAMSNPLVAVDLIPKLGTGMLLVKEVPSFTARTLTGFKQILTYAMNNKIEVPSDATQFLSN